MKKKLLWTLLLTGGLISSITAFIFTTNLYLQAHVPVIMPFFSLSADDEMWNKLGYVVAEGTWVMDTPDEMNTPFLANKIICVKKEGICRDVEASVSRLAGLTYLQVHVDEFSISRWDDTQIIYENVVPACFTYVYSINRVTQQVSGIRMSRANNGTENCLDAQKNDTKLKLTSGFDVFQEHKARNTNIPFIVSILILLTLIYFTGVYLVWRTKKIAAPEQS